MVESIVVVDVNEARWSLGEKDEVVDNQYKPMSTEISYIALILGKVVTRENGWDLAEKLAQFNSANAVEVEKSR